MNNYYIEQGNAINQKLNEGSTILIEDLKGKIEKIKEELEKTNDYTAETHINNCIDMCNKINDDLLLKIIDKIELVKKIADTWQEGFNELISLEGNNGYDWAVANDFETNTETKTITVSNQNSNTKSDNNFVYTDSMALTDGFSLLFGGSNNQKTETITIYYWTAYIDITINNEGYIDFKLNRYKSENKDDKNGEITETENITIRSLEDFNKWLKKNKLSLTDNPPVSSSYNNDKTQAPENNASQESSLETRMLAMKDGDKITVYDKESGKEVTITRKGNKWLSDDSRRNSYRVDLFTDIYTTSKPQTNATPAATSVQFDYEKIRTNGTVKKDGSIVLSTGPGSSITLFQDGTIKTLEVDSNYPISPGGITTTTTTTKQYDQNGILVTTSKEIAKFDQNHSLIEITNEIYDANNNLTSSTTKEY